MKKLTVDDIERARIPKRFWTVSFRKIADCDYKLKIKNYALKIEDMIKDGIGLFIYSKENSTGKTSIAVVIVKQALKIKKTALFVRADELKDAKISHKVFDEESSLIDRALKVDLLVIDDADKEYKGGSNYAGTLVETIIRDRSQRKMATIITSNRTPGEIAEIYTRDLAELLTECMIPIKIVGESEGGVNWRKKIASEIRELI